MCDSLRLRLDARSRKIGDKTTRAPREWDAQKLHSLQRAHLGGEEYVRHRLVEEARRRAQQIHDVGQTDSNSLIARTSKSFVGSNKDTQLGWIIH